MPRLCAKMRQTANLVVYLWHVERLKFKSQSYNHGQKLMAKRQNLAFPKYTESVKFMSQSRETASKRKPYRGLGTR